MSITTTSTGFSITAQLQGREKALAELHKLTGRKLDTAVAKAINDTVYQVKRAYVDEISAVFDRPTDYIKKSVWIKQATPDRLVASIDPSYFGGKGVEPVKVLKAQAVGGRRRDKRSEVALRSAGILPTGYQAVIPSDPFPGSEDAHGNIKGSFMVQLLSYLQAFGEQGYRSNMTDKRKLAIHKRGGAKVKAVGPQLGRRYVVAYGKMRGGARLTARGEQDERMSNLTPGIWAVMGSGAVIKPVLMFTRMGDYQVRLRMEDVGKRADADVYLDQRLRFRIREAAGV